MTGSLLRSTVFSLAAWTLLLWALPTPEASGQIHSIKLFDAVPVTPSGPLAHASDAVTFGQTELVLLCPATPSAIISSDPFGTAPFVVDNFLIVNGRNVCAALNSANSCFQTFNGGSSEASRAYVGVPALDISRNILSGNHSVSFALTDHGALLGSSEVWLVTNCFVWTQKG